MPSGGFDVQDVNGDGVPDLIGYGGTRLAVRLGTAERVSFPMHLVESEDDLFGEVIDHVTDVQRHRPVFQDLDQDFLVDMVVPVVSGVHVALGGPDGRFTPITHPTLSGEALSGRVFVPLPGPTPSSGDLILILDGNSLGVASDAFAMRPESALELPAGHDARELAGRVALGAPALFALAFTGETRVWVGAIDAGIPGTVAEVALPGRVKEEDGARFVDVDGDGREDLVVSLVVDSTARIAVARATGPGAFDRAELDARFDALVTEGCASGPWPLAAADLDDDGVADYVGDLGVCLTDPADGTPRLAATHPSEERWSEALIADFNRDGAPDVAATTHSTLSIDFLFTDPGGRSLFNHARTPIEGVPRALRAGDFNGDFIDDVAVIEEGSASGVRAETLSVVFGAAHALPGGAVQMARFGRVSAIEAGDIHLNAAPRDLTRDLIVVANRGDDAGERSLFVLHGSQSGLRAPFPLRVPQPGALDLAFDLSGPTALATFHTRANSFDEASADAVVLASNHGPGGPERALWRLRGAGDGTWVDALRIPIRHEALLADPSCIVLTPVFAPLRIGESMPPDQVMGVTLPDPRCAATVSPLVVINLDEIDSGGDVLVTTLSGSIGHPDYSSPTSIEITRLGFIISYAGEAALGLRADADPTRFRGAGVVVYNDRGGHQYRASREIVTFPSATAESPVQPLATALVTDYNTEGTVDNVQRVRDGLAILTTAGIYLGPVAGLPALSGPVPVDARASTHMIARDVNRDGLEDLVFNGPGQISVYLNVPTNARDEWFWENRR
jgi:hypothetical protein